MNEYLLSEEEELMIRSFLPEFDRDGGFRVFLTEDGKLIIKNSPEMWRSLCGRAWIIDKERKTCSLFAMS